MKRQWSVMIIVGLVLVNVIPALAQSEVQLPPLTGEYAVGRTSYDFADSSRLDPFIPASNQPREVAVKVYYPAEGAPTETTTPYAEGLEVDALALALHYPVSVVETNIRAHAVTDAPLSSAAKTFPVVLFTGDIGSTALYYSGLLEDLASHGYIVAAISHPYSSSFAVLSDGRIALPVSSGSEETVKTTAGRDQVGEVWTADIGFVLDQLTQLNSSDERFSGRLDLSHPVIIGHGFGGGVALDTVASDSRFAGGVSLDGRVLGDTASKTLDKPVMFIDPASASLRPTAESATLDELKADTADTLYNVEVDTATGDTFASDLDLLNSVFADTPQSDITASDSPSTVIRSYVEAFLDQQVKGETAPLLESTAVAIEGVQMDVVEPQTK